jgi:hypothetical protein
LFHFTLMSNPSQWSPEDVGQQLRAAGLGRYTTAFVNGGITGRSLYEMSEKRMRELGLPAPARLALQNYIQSLPRPQKPTGARQHPRQARGFWSSCGIVPRSWLRTATAPRSAARQKGISNTDCPEEAACQTTRRRSAAGVRGGEPRTRAVPVLLEAIRA